MSAPDPFALNLIDDGGETERAHTSRLTIVRVPSSGASAVGQTPPDSPNLGRRASWGARRGSGSSIGELTGGKPRLSFAFSTFTPINPPPGSTSPEIGRAHNKQRSLSNASAIPFAGRKNLSPEQLLEIAQNPVGSTPAVSPGAPATNEQGFEPAPFEPLSSEIWLPFLDRPREVTALVSAPPTKQLFAVICQALPQTIAADTDSNDPKHWTADQLTTHLTEATRAESDDRAWAQATRSCIASHSELLWERFKGALGVPPELDEDPLLEEDMFSDSPGGADDTALDDEYDDSLSGSIDLADETWVEPIYTTSELGAQLPLQSPREGGGGSIAGDLEAIGEREEETAGSKDSRGSNEPIQGIRIYTSAAASPFPTSRRSYSHSHMTSAETSPVLHNSIASNSSPLGRSTSLRDSRRRFSSGLHFTQAGSSGLSGSALGRSKSLQHGPRGVGALGGLGGSQMVAPHTERTPGNPLFVSSFATLSAGPTLVAKYVCLPVSREYVADVFLLQQPLVALFCITTSRASRAVTSWSRLGLRDLCDERQRARLWRLDVASRSLSLSVHVILSALCTLLCFNPSGVDTVGALLDFAANASRAVFAHDKNQHTFVRSWTCYEKQRSVRMRKQLKA